MEKQIMYVFKISNKKTGQETTTSAVSLKKAINNVRFTRKELYYKIADYTGVIV